MELTFYKPTKKKTGGAVKFNVHKTGKYSFMKGARQIADMGEQRVFGWDDDESINVKMMTSDLGALLSVIEGYAIEGVANLFHQTDKDNKTIQFTHMPDRGGYSLKITHKIKGASEANSVFLGITYAEAMILKIYMEDTIREMLQANMWSGEQ